MRSRNRLCSPVSLVVFSPRTWSIRTFGIRRNHGLI